MKHQIIIIFAVLMFSNSLGLAVLSWVPIKNQPTTNKLSDVGIIDENTAVAVGDLGTILRTTDGGNNWRIINTNLRNDLVSVDFSNNFGVAAGMVGDIRLGDPFKEFLKIPQTSESDNLQAPLIYSTNAGVSWSIVNEVLYPPNNKLEWNVINDIITPNNTTAIAVGYGGTIIYTTDAGATWDCYYWDNSEWTSHNSLVFDDKNNPKVTFEHIDIDKNNSDFVYLTDQMNIFKFQISSKTLTLVYQGSDKFYSFGVIDNDDFLIFENPWSKRHHPYWILKRLHIISQTTATRDDVGIIPIENKLRTTTQNGFMSYRGRLERLKVLKIGSSQWEVIVPYDAGRFIRVSDYNNNNMLSNSLTLTNRMKNANTMLNCDFYFYGPSEQQSVAYSVGLKGTILKSTDIGNTWQNSFENKELLHYNSVAFDDNHDNILTTRDFGGIEVANKNTLIWKKKQFSTKRSINDIFSVQQGSKSIYWAVGENGFIAKSYDGGDSWKKIDFNCFEDEIDPLVTVNMKSLPHINKIYFVDAAHGYLLCNSVKYKYSNQSNYSSTALFKTTNGGYSWSPVELMFDYSGSFIDSYSGDLNCRLFDIKENAGALYICGVLNKHTGINDIECGILSIILPSPPGQKTMTHQLNQTAVFRGVWFRTMELYNNNTLLLGGYRTNDFVQLPNVNEGLIAGAGAGEIMAYGFVGEYNLSSGSFIGEKLKHDLIWNASGSNPNELLEDLVAYVPPYEQISASIHFPTKIYDIAGSFASGCDGLLLQVNTSSPFDISDKTYLSNSNSLHAVKSIAKSGTGSYYACGNFGTIMELKNVIQKISQPKDKATIPSDNFYLYPNPCVDDVGYFSIDFIKHPIKNFSIKVFNFEGKLILHEENVTVDSKINVADLPHGIYFVHVFTDINYGVKKLLILK